MIRTPGKPFLVFEAGGTAGGQHIPWTITIHIEGAPSCKRPVC